MAKFQIAGLAWLMETTKVTLCFCLKQPTDKRDFYNSNFYRDDQQIWGTRVWTWGLNDHSLHTSLKPTKSHHYKAKCYELNELWLLLLDTDEANTEARIITSSHPEITSLMLQKLQNYCSFIIWRSSIVFCGNQFCFKHILNQQMHRGKQNQVLCSQMGI